MFMCSPVDTIYPFYPSALHSNTYSPRWESHIFALHKNNNAVWIHTLSVRRWYITVRDRISTSGQTLHTEYFGASSILGKHQCMLWPQHLYCESFQSPMTFRAHPSTRLWMELVFYSGEKARQKPASSVLVVMAAVQQHTAEWCSEPIKAAPQSGGGGGGIGE